MKAKVNGLYILDGQCLNEIDNERAYFIVPKGENDRVWVEAVLDGSFQKMSDCSGKWLLRIKTELIEWED